MEYFNICDICLYLLSDTVTLNFVIYVYQIFGINSEKYLRKHAGFTQSCRYI